MEQTAEKAHNTWWKRKEDEGFHSPLECPSQPNVILVDSYSKWERLCNNCNTDMYPYEELEEKE